MSDNIDNQISSIEEQLKKAQDTLLDLQKLKQNLEADRKKNEAKAREDTEKQELENENKKLKNQLSSYHDEINSLRNIISSLKDDLSKTAEQFQSKVENSLKLLETTDMNSKKSVNQENKDKPAPHLSTASPDVKENSAETKDEKSEPEAKSHQDTPKEVNAEEAKLEQDDAGKIEPEKADALPETDKTMPSTAVDTPEANETPASVETTSDEKNDQEPTAEAKEETPVDSPPILPVGKTADENLADEELDEYEKIKKELESIITENPEAKVKNENEAIAQTTGSEKTEGNSSEKFWHKTDDKKKNEQQKERKFLFFFRKKSKSPEPVAEPPIAPPANPQEPQETVENNDSSQPPATQDSSAQENKPAEANADKNVAVAEEKTDQSTEQTATANKALPKDGGGKLLVKAAVVLIFICAGGIGYQIFNADKLRDVYLTQAKDTYIKNAPVNADVPDEFSKEAPEVKYHEAYFDTDFKNTAWSTHNDKELGIKIDYPKNTSFRYKPVGSDNLWFLRKNGFLVKIEKIVTESSITDYIPIAKGEIDYKSEDVSLKGLPAIHLANNETTGTSGNIYLVKVKNCIYKIWYKTYQNNENTDDEQRVAKMLDSIQFLNAKSDSD